MGESCLEIIQQSSWTLVLFPLSSGGNKSLGVLVQEGAGNSHSGSWVWVAEARSRAGLGPLESDSMIVNPSFTTSFLCHFEKLLCFFSF